MSGPWGFNVQWKGMDDLRKALDKLPPELAKTAEKAALRDAMKPVAAAAKANAGSSKDSGLLQESIGITVRKVRSGRMRGEHTARVGPRGGRGRRITRIIKSVNADGSVELRYRREYADPTKYAHLVELGTAHSPARPFLRPAILSNQSKIPGLLAKGYSRGFERAVRRARR